MAPAEALTYALLPVPPQLKYSPVRLQASDSGLPYKRLYHELLRGNLLCPPGVQL